MKYFLSVLLVLFLSWGQRARAAEADLYCLTGTSSTGAPIFQPATTANPCPTSGGGSGGAVTITPQPAAPTVGASQSITSLVLRASPTSATGGVQYFHAENATATSGYCILYNATAAPGTGALNAALVLAFQLLPANGYADWHAGAQPPIAASAGAVVLLTSAANPYTYTTGAITGSIYGLAQ